MGLRGAVPEDPGLRATRGARVQDTVVYGVPAREGDRARWLERAEALEARGMALVTKKKPGRDDLATGLKLLAAANILWQRLARIPGIGPANGRTDKTPETLDDFRRRRGAAR